MGRSFFFYWQGKQLSEAINEELLDHSASDQFAKIKPGDTLWIGGRGHGNLVTIGPLRVNEVLGPQESKRRLHNRAWEKKYTAVCAEGDTTIPREVALDSVLGKLRFISKDRTSLDLQRPLGNQLQRLRQLTPDSDRILGEIWGAGVKPASNEFTQVQSELAQFDELDEKRQVIVRKEQHLLRKHLFQGRGAGICGICEEQFPIELLVAAHIKPRKGCSNEERQDMANIAPMCMLGCDALFERGLLCVTEGKIKVNIPSTREPALQRFVGLHGRSLRIWKPERKKYFDWHAESSAKRAREGSN